MEFLYGHAMVYLCPMGLRQEKFARLMQKDMGELLNQHRIDWLAGEFVTISQVRVSPDLGHVKFYLSMFNSTKRGAVLENLELNAREIRMELSRRLKNQMRKMPEIAFYEDDTLDYVDKMEKIFEGLKENKPHQNPDSGE
ncbi:MAG: 30S ribosome-binding factor RbfA [Bacteroidetes bacterium]|nr:30S ribosome-binding factor RbfA [Bacteroidota bacterium]